MNLAGWGRSSAASPAGSAGEGELAAERPAPQPNDLALKIREMQSAQAGASAKAPRSSESLYSGSSKRSKRSRARYLACSHRCESSEIDLQGSKGSSSSSSESESDRNPRGSKRIAGKSNRKALDVSSRSSARRLKRRSKSCDQQPSI